MRDAPSRMRRIGNAFGIGLAWAVAWAPVAVLIGVGMIDPDDSMDEMWVVVGAYPGFITGAIFYALAALAARGRRLAELPLSSAALHGALAALPVGVVPFLIGEPTTAMPLWQLAGIWSGAVMLMGALSATATVLVARSLSRRRLRDA